MVPAESPSIAQPPPDLNIAIEVNVFFEETHGSFFTVTLDFRTPKLLRPCPRCTTRSMIPLSLMRGDTFGMDCTLRSSPKHRHLSVHFVSDLFSAIRLTTRLQVEDVIHIVSPRCDRSSSPICDDNTPAVVLQAGSTPSKVIEAAPVPPILLSTVVIAAPIHILEPPPPRVFTTNGPRVLDVRDLGVIRFLGEGTSGKVYFVKDRISKAKLALKVVPKAGKSEYTLNVLVEERELMEKLSDSPWFVNLWGSWHDSANLYIAMVGRRFYSSTSFRAHVRQLL
jgi:hypothetical protein